MILWEEGGRGRGGAIKSKITDFTSQRWDFLAVMHSGGSQVTDLVSANKKKKHYKLKTKNGLFLILM